VAKLPDKPKPTSTLKKHSRASVGLSGVTGGGAWGKRHRGTWEIRAMSAEVGWPRSSEEGSNDPGAKGVCSGRATIGVECSAWREPITEKKTSINRSKRKPKQRVDRFEESRMREICKSGSTRGRQVRKTRYAVIETRTGKPRHRIDRNLNPDDLSLYSTAFRSSFFSFLFPCRLPLVPSSLGTGFARLGVCDNEGNGSRNMFSILACVCRNLSPPFSLPP